MSLTGAELIQDCSIELTIGRRYGLLGQNGCGKSNFLKCLAAREVRGSFFGLFSLSLSTCPKES